MTTAPTALVTGATSGIGRATAHALSARGFEVYAVGRNDVALAALRSDGLHARALDVTDEAACMRLVDDILTDRGCIDVLVNSAGFPLPCPLEQVPLDTLRSLFETSLVSALHLSQLVLPGMRERRSGTIVTIGSTGGRFSSAGAGGYHIVKFGVEAFSLSLRAEVAPYGVRVVLIDPTGVRTRFIDSQHEEMVTYADDDPYGEFKRRYAATTLRLTTVPGLMIDADTVARAVLRAVDAKDPKPRYVVGLSGKFSVVARALLSDRMWERVMTRDLRS